MVQFDPDSQILYEDNHVIVVNKLPRQIIQGDKTGDTPLGEQIKQFLKIRDHKPGNVFLGVVHRLDRPVSGTVIFAKTSKALGRLNKMLEERLIEKTYWAVVNKIPDPIEGHLVHFLYKVQEKNKSYASDKQRGNSKRAELKYRYLISAEHYHLVEVQLLTGRHHQIRVQLAKIRCLIKGDIKYGSPRPNGNGSIHLHARKIEFIHPVSREKIILTAEPPPDALWSFFCENIDN